uniref:zinc finger CCCH domain-containing protein 12-like isoform X2 n=1 Tax=Erigeron canadensis TaxID=72917 RepID=UPI001CB8C159|nr:zinc finger CCCH domain-containing protein 12-like isoform X2 [Erigeron canadensis]
MHPCGALTYTNLMFFSGIKGFNWPVSATMYEYNKTFTEDIRTADLSYEEYRPVEDHRANVAKLEDTFQFPALGSSKVSMEAGRSCKSRYCKMFSTASGCPFGNNCTYNHDEQSINRETTTIVLGRASAVGHRNGGVTGNQGPVPLPARPMVLSSPLPPPLSSLTIARATFNTNLKPPNWRTRICSQWEQAGYCPFGSKCNFAHGEAELQRYGGGPLNREANLNNQGLVFLKNVAASVVGPSVSSVACAGGSEKLPIAEEKSFQKWPKKINRIYGDWIDDIE